MRSVADDRTWRATSWLPTATAATADTAATIHRAVTWKSTARRVPSLTIWLGVLEHVLTARERAHRRHRLVDARTGGQAHRGDRRHPADVGVIPEDGG